MPLPSDEKLLALSNEILEQFETIFGAHPGFRPAHAKGIMLTGTFTPAAAADKLTRAPHISRDSTPVTVRFSDSTGLPTIPDTDPNANPKGMAIRFHLAEHSHTDIVAHSADGFPTRTGAEFLDFLRAIASTDPAVPPDPANPKPVELFLRSHPAALRYVQAPKPAPSSFGRENYFGVTAMEFINAEGTRQFGRYRILPANGTDYLDEIALGTYGPNYLFAELPQRLTQGPIVFHIKIQLAAPGDVVDDATVHWPEDNPTVELGTVELTTVIAENDAQQKQIIFDPIPRVDGIEPSNDPLLELRAAVYLISGRRRRAAPAQS
jgi:catalase